MLKRMPTVNGGGPEPKYTGFFDDLLTERTGKHDGDNESWIKSRIGFAT